jgi:hypothetical protein
MSECNEKILFCTTNQDGLVGRIFMQAENFGLLSGK